MQRVFHFSGGPSSARMVIENYRPGDIVLFCDTTREHAKTYKFINDFEAHEKIPVTRISYPGGFRGLIIHKSIIPNALRRACTEQLKIKTARRWLVYHGIKHYESFIGFRADEERRVRKHKEFWKTVVTRFPLYENGTDNQMVNHYWSLKPYRLEIPAILKNCTLCFMKGKNAVMAILSSYPELADPWIADEELAEHFGGHTYFKGVTIRELRDMAQNNLFSNYDLTQVTPAFDCACTS